MAQTKVFCAQSENVTPSQLNALTHVTTVLKVTDVDALKAFIWMNLAQTVLRSIPVSSGVLAHSFVNKYHLLRTSATATRTTSFCLTSVPAEARIAQSLLLFTLSDDSSNPSTVGQVLLKPYYQT